MVQIKPSFNKILVGISSITYMMVPDSRKLLVVESSETINFYLHIVQSSVNKLRIVTNRLSKI